MFRFAQHDLVLALNMASTQAPLNLTLRWPQLASLTLVAWLG
ncbi:MAG TPA: hypothetical protein VFP40_09330 [Terriglobales bacterium]|nr:hypothetical protein [Terriglobales bacterium]